MWQTGVHLVSLYFFFEILTPPLLDQQLTVTLIKILIVSAMDQVTAISVITKNPSRHFNEGYRSFLKFFRIWEKPMDEFSFCLNLFLLPLAAQSASDEIPIY